MKDLIPLYWNKKQFLAMLLTAFAYAILLIPLKPIPIVPGFTELRPANAIPVAFGVLFGPAAAWGSAFGNLAADFFGTLTPASAFGFAGNFLFAYVAYFIWKTLIGKSKVVFNAKQLGVYELAALVSSVFCSLVISLGVFFIYSDFLQAALLFGFISLNNFIPAALIGLLIVLLAYPKMKRAGWILS